MNSSRQADPGKRLWVLLGSFAGARAAPKARRTFEKQICLGGSAILDEILLVVDSKHNVRLYDPGKVARGGVAAGLAWGVFGLVTGGWIGLLVWGVLGALCGAAWALDTEHTLSRALLQRIGAALPPESSAILAFVAVEPADAATAVAPAHTPAWVAVGSVGAELSSDKSNNGAPAEADDPSSRQVLTMLLFRYEGRNAAGSVIKKLNSVRDGGSPVTAELAVEMDTRGKVHVHKPELGLGFQAESSAVSWGLFGLALAALSGLVGGGGLIGAIEAGSPLLAGFPLLVAWGILGAVAGVLYGLWVGRGATGRRIRVLGPLLAPDTSLLLAWVDSALTQEALGALSTPDSKSLILDLRAVGRGAALVAA